VPSRSPEAIESRPTTDELESDSSGTVGTVVGVCVGVIAAGAGAAVFVIARRRCGADDQAAADSGGLEKGLDEHVQDEADAL
jgi:hypothetical protein